MRAIYLLAALVISAQAHADTTYPVSRTFNGNEYYYSGGPPNCIPLGSPLSGESVPCGGGHADDTRPASNLSLGHGICAGNADACGGGSGGINTTQQVLDAKKLIDDLSKKQSALDALSHSGERITVTLANLTDIACFQTTFPSGLCDFSTTIDLPRQLILDALQSQIDDDKATLSAMGIKQ